MKLSIITPSYNQGKFIAKTFDSILDQAGDIDIEYILVDAESTDETPNIVKKYLPEFRKVGIDFRYICEKDKGQSDAINKGWKIASGEIITYLNSDDYYEKDVLRDVLKYFNNNPKTKWAYGGWNIVNKNGKIYSTTLRDKFIKNKLLNYCNIGQPSCFFKKELLDEFGYLDENLHLAMDYDLWLRFASKYEAGMINKIISNMRYYREAKSSDKTKEQLFELLKLSKRYSRAFSLRRFMQYLYFTRGLILTYFKKDLSTRVAKKSNE